MAYESNSIFWVETEKVVPNPFQPRKEFNEENLQGLADSIRMYGILQPLTVTRKEVPLADGAFRTEYELVAGERRLRASKIAGLAQVPVIIRTGEESELMKLELAIIENIQREDLNPVDRARAFKQLSSAFGLSHSDVAKKVGRSRMYVSNSIRLLNLPDTIIGALSQGDITDGHARTLLMLNDRPEEQDVVFREILLKKLSVREVEKIARKIAKDKVRKKRWDDSDPEMIEIEKQLTDTLGTKVQISKTEYGGRVVIDYFSDEDLRSLLDKVHVQSGNEIQPLSGVQNDELARITDATPLEIDMEETEVPKEPQPDMDNDTPDVITEVPKEPQSDMDSDVPSVTEEKHYSEEEIQHMSHEIVTQGGVPEGFELVDSEEVVQTDTPSDSPDSTPKSSDENGKKEGNVSVEEDTNEHDAENHTTDSVEEVLPVETLVDDTTNADKKESDDDLYSFKNFSL